MTRTYRKNILRTFKSTRSRFLAVFSIVALGVGFLAGLSATPVDMKASMEEYMDAGNFYDLRVLSTLGLTDEDAGALAAVEGVEAVQPAYSADLLVTAGEADTVVARAHSLPPDDGINRLVLVEGRMPTAPGECVVEAGANEMNRDFAVGTTFLLGEDNENLDEKLAVTEFTVVGIVHNANYFSFEREPASVGNGTVGLVFYVRPSDFAYEAYTEIYLTAAGARELDSLGEDYQTLVDALAQRVEGIQDARCQARYDGIQAQARAELDDAWAEYRDAEREAEEELAEAAEELADGRKELADGEKEYTDGEKEYADGAAEIAENEKKIADGTEQLAAARRQLEEGQAAWEEGWRRFKDGEAQLGEAKKQLDAGQAQYDAGKAQYDAALQQIEEGEAQLAQGKAKLDEGQAQYDAGKAQYDAALKQIEEGEAQLADGKAKLDEGQARYDAGKAQYDAALGQIEEGEAQLAEGKKTLDEAQAQYDDGVRQLVEQANEQGLALTVEQVDEVIAALAAIDPDEIPQDPYELLKLLAELGAGLLPDTVPPGTAEEIQNTLDTVLAALEEVKTEENAEQIEALQEILRRWQGVDDETLQTLLDELREQLPTLDEETKQKLEELLASLEKPELPEDVQKLLDGILLLVDARRQLDAGWAAYNENKALLEAGRAELEASLPALEEARAQLDAGRAEYNENKALLEAGRAELEASLPALEEARAQLEAGWAEYNENKALLEAGRAELAASLPALEAARGQLEAGWAEYNAAGDQLYEGKRQLEETRKLLEENWTLLADKQRELEDARRQIDEARQKLADARTELDDARQTIAENKQKLLDGEIEYEDAKAEVEQKLADARQEIEDAERDLDELAYPEWYVWDRSQNVSFASFDANVSKLQAITTIFPVFFFLVAALVVSTTMTRMIEEERLQIGTMKALGYARGEIMKKYLWYAFIAAAAGTLCGLAVGFYAFPTIIWTAYGIMYYMPGIQVPWLADKALFAGGTLIGLTVGITALACRSSLSEVPAALMLPRAPKAGKRIFLERIGPLWRRLPFTWKVTCRNLLRYQKRFWMTVIGVAGCTALLVTGFGIADSLDAIIANQYGRVYHYDLTTAVAHPEDTVRGEVYDYLFGSDFTASLAASTEKVSQHAPGGANVDCYLLIPQDTAAFANFADLHERVSGQPVPLGETGVVLTEKFAATMGVGTGDTVTLENADGARADFVVTGVCEHYVYNYAYISAAAFEQAFGTPPTWNTILTQLPDTSQQAQDAVSARLLAMDAVAGLSFTTDQMVTVFNMLNAIDSVVLLIIVCAGALAFVVLYNLSNINIAERVKEIATIKVLGFYDREVDAYVNRETVALTLIGALLGLVLGVWLHRFIIVTVEVDAVMFGRDIAPLSFVYALVLTMLFGTVINLIMGLRLRRISMVESMKAPE